MDWSAWRIADDGRRTELSTGVVSYAFGPHSLRLTLAEAPWLPAVAAGDVVEVTCRAGAGLVRQRFQIGWVERIAGDSVARGREVDGSPG